MSVRIFTLDRATPSEFRLWKEALRLRNTVLKEQLGWDLYTREGAEVDQYDNPLAVNVCALDAVGNLTAYVRLNPMTWPFLLRDHFAGRFACEFGSYCDNGQGYESTRAVLAPALKGPARTRALAEMMSASMVFMGRHAGLRRIYFVTEKMLVPHLLGPFGLDVTFFEPRDAGTSLAAGFYEASEAKGLEIARQFGLDIEKEITGATAWAV